MQILLQLSGLFILTLIGEAISSVLPFTFPGTLIAMFLLLIILRSGIVKETQLKESATFFSRYMAMFFVPAGVEIVENLEILRTSWIPLVAISIISLFITFFVAAKAVEIAEHVTAKRRSE